MGQRKYEKNVQEFSKKMKGKSPQIFITLQDDAKQNIYECISQSNCGILKFDEYLNAKQRKLLV